LCGIDRAGREEAANLPESAGLGSYNVTRGAIRTEVPDEATEFLSELSIADIPDRIVLA
jgi:hypothetical protein